MHKRLSRIHLPAAGDEINCDYIHQALHPTTVTTTWNSPWLPSYSLWLFGSLLNSSICLLSFTLIFFLSHHPSSPLLFSFCPAHSLSFPSLPASIVIHLYSKAIMLSFFFSSTQILGYPHPTMCPPSLYPVLSHHPRHDCEAAAITVFFEVSYYNIPNRDLSCQPSHITAQQGHLHLVGPPASTLMEASSGKANQAGMTERSDFFFFLKRFCASYELNNRTDRAN